MAVSKKEVRRLIGVIRDTIRTGMLFNSGFYSRDELAQIVQDVVDEVARYDHLTTVRQAAQWKASDGPVLWWTLPVSGTPFLGIPGDSGWSAEYTHWTPIPEPVL
jgi:hypothetical protein